MDERVPGQATLSRRRVIKIAGAALGLAALPRASSAAPTLRTWRGTALGADAHLSLYHSDPHAAERIIAACVTEVRRLEAVFSLFDPSSSLSSLNRQGLLDSPPPELLFLLTESQRVGALTGGAFDVTVQPLWRLFAGHFSQADADPAGPPVAAIDQARSLVDFRRIDVTPRLVRYHRPGMAVTLNGIAQGFITDRVAALLKAQGMARVLIDMGELRGLGRHPDGRPWRVGVTDPLSPGEFSHVVDVADQAIASSGGYGTRFGSGGNHHHLFDPNTGNCAPYHAGVTVMAPTATLADALSTTFAVMPTPRVNGIVERFKGVTVTLTEPDGRRVLVPA